MAVATPAPKRATVGAKMPTIPKLVRVAKIPAAGVKAPYAQLWKAAAKEPWELLANICIFWTCVATHQGLHRTAQSLEIARMSR